MQNFTLVLSSLSLAVPPSLVIPTPVLLAYSMETTGLRDNVIKITDFGLAREIEHTTYMSGAGTYPWMAPEIIRTSNFSKKSDVWRYVVKVPQGSVFNDFVNLGSVLL